MSSARHYGYLGAVGKGNRRHKEGTQATNWGKVFATHVTSKGLVFRIYQELQISKKKKNRPVLKWGVI